MRLLMLLGTVVLCVAANTPSQHRVRPVATGTTEHAEFALLDVGLPTASIQRYEPGGAPHAYVFYFLVQRRGADASGHPLVHNEFDFNVDGESYSAITHSRIGKSFEPLIVAEDASQFRTRIRPDLASIVPSNDTDAIVFYVIAPGVRLPRSTRISATFSAGWGDHLEQFAFTASLP
jgi:hypothetical protein